MAFNIREYAESHFGSLKTSTGAEVETTCPCCEKSGSFYLNTQSGAFICFKCDFKGKSVTGLVAHIEGVSWSRAKALVFRQATRKKREGSVFSLMDRLNAVRSHAVKDEEDRPTKADPPDGYRPCYSKGHYSMPRWLTKDRGITKRTAKAWGLGYCVFGRYTHRLIIPIICPNGESYSGRDMTGDAERKYLNPWDFDKSRLLIGWHCTPLTGDVVLCEGPFDALKLWQHDIPALALGGKTLHSAQLSLLTSHLSSETSITVMLDPEEEEGSLKIATSLNQYFANVYRAKLPDGIDPGDSSRKQAQLAVERATRWRGLHVGTRERLRALL